MSIKLLFGMFSNILSFKKKQYVIASGERLQYNSIKTTDNIGLALEVFVRMCETVNSQRAI